MLTKPSSIQRGQHYTFTLSKAALLAHASVVLNTYFRDAAVWDSVSLTYESDVRDQRTVVLFDAKVETPEGDFHVSTRSVGAFRIYSLSILDSDGGSLTIMRDQLNASNFDVDFS